MSHSLPTYFFFVLKLVLRAKRRYFDVFMETVYACKVTHKWTETFACQGLTAEREVQGKNGER